MTDRCDLIYISVPRNWTLALAQAVLMNAKAVINGEQSEQRGRAQHQMLFLIADQEHIRASVLRIVSEFSA